MFDLLLKGGRVVDPRGAFDGLADLALAGGRVVRLGPDLDPGQAKEVLDVTGQTLVPGLIDLHVHASSWLGGALGHRMMAKAGVVTALDLSGPPAGVLDMAREHGAGLNLACLNYVRPGDTVADANPSRDELEELLRTSLGQGALGFKILGGHYPLTPEATARAMEAAHQAGAYLAFHAGTLEKGSDLEGFEEAVALSQGRPFHLAHINSYCRGRIKNNLVEAEEAAALLEANPHVRSESYLSPFNGTSGQCRQGEPLSRVTRDCLAAGGHPPTEEGLAQAILAGYALVNLPQGGEMGLQGGPRALEYWRAQQTITTISFPVNPLTARLHLATAKRKDGSFAVDCLATDGGGIPRNVTVAMGLALIRLGAMSLAEFVLKASTNPAMILGLTNKGTLRPGADADLTGLDLEGGRAVLAVRGGQVIMVHGHVCGRGARFITTPLGVEAVRAAGLEPVVVDPAKRPFFGRTWRPGAQD